MKIRDIVSKAETIPYLTIPGDCALEELARLVARNRQIRGVYVVDEQERLQGYLSLGVLIRSVIASRDKPHFHVRSLLTLIASEKVEDVMEKHVVCAKPDDDARKILDKMVHRNIKQIPLIDENHHLIGNLGILDLWSLLDVQE